MHNWTVPLVLFVLFDVLVMVLVLRKVLKIRVNVTTQINRGGNGITTLDQLRALGDFARQEHDKIGEFMRANWSGFAEQLPSVLTSLLDGRRRPGWRLASGGLSTRAAALKHVDRLHFSTRRGG